MKYIVLVLAALVSACASHRANEEFGKRPVNPIKTIQIEFIQTKNGDGHLSVPAPVGFKADFQTARNKADTEFPKLHTLLRQGVENQLIPMLSARLIAIPSEGTSTPTAKLRIEPLSGVVECGAASLFCQASVFVKLRLIDDSLEPIWTATYKVGAPMNGTNDAEVTRVFYSNVVERLALSNLIR